MQTVNQLECWLQLPPPLFLTPAPRLTLASSTRLPQCVRQGGSWAVLALQSDALAGFSSGTLPFLPECAWANYLPSELSLLLRRI